jgi:hypothetical protein
MPNKLCRVCLGKNIKRAIRQSPLCKFPCILKADSHHITHTRRFRCHIIFSFFLLWDKILSTIFWWCCDAISFFISSILCLLTLLLSGSTCISHWQIRLHFLTSLIPEMKNRPFIGPHSYILLFTITGCLIESTSTYRNTQLHFVDVCLVYSLMLRMEAFCSFKTLTKIYQT